MGQDTSRQHEAGLGSVTSVKGSSVGIALDDAAPPQRATVGTFVAVRAGSAHIVGMLTALSRDLDGERPRATGRLDLLGQIEGGAQGGARCFRRGVTEYPVIGDRVELIASADLKLIFAEAGDRAAVGTLQQDPDTAVSLRIDDLVSKHFAVLGTTGVGKSCGVAVILREIMEARDDLRVFLLDGHNEYGRCFGDRANVISVRNLKLPFWLFNFDEILDVIFGGRPPVPEEVEILAELIPVAKASYSQYRSLAERVVVKRVEPSATGLTVDTPVPYVLQDLLALIDDRMGRLENRVSRLHYHRLVSRIETIRNDPRYAFMFANANVGGDMMADLLAHLFRIESPDQPISVMQMAGLPVEVMDAVVSVLCRLAFDLGLWSEGRFPLLFVCEEAHRYAAADRTIGFNPTRRALSRIAKEGRKYGVFLGLVTQRPAELDPTILSQCSTLFGMRMANDDDQALMRSAVSDAASTLLDFLPSLGTREVIGFGEGVPLPARLTFKTLPAEFLPRAETAGYRAQDAGDATARALLEGAVERWRGATMASPRLAREAPVVAAPEPSAEAPARTAQAAALDQVRERMLRRPDPAGARSFADGGRRAAGKDA